MSPGEECTEFVHSFALHFFSSGADNSRIRFSAFARSCDLAASLAFESPGSTSRTLREAARAPARSPAAI